MYSTFRIQYSGMQPTDYIILQYRIGVHADRHIRVYLMVSQCGGNTSLCLHRSKGKVVTRPVVL
jgi:hypothetical protein